MLQVESTEKCIKSHIWFRFTSIILLNGNIQPKLAALQQLTLGSLVFDTIIGFYMILVLTPCIQLVHHHLALSQYIWVRLASLTRVVK